MLQRSAFSVQPSLNPLDPLNSRFPTRTRTRPNRRGLIEALERRLHLSDVKICLGNTAETPYSLWENSHQYLYVSVNMIPFDEIINVSYQVLAGTATQGTDVIITGSLTIGDIVLGGGGEIDESVANIRIPADNLVEGDETFRIRLLPGTGYDIEYWDYPLHNNPAGDPATGHYVIHDDPPIVSIQATDASGTEHAAGEDPDPTSFRVLRTGGDVNSPITVTFSVSGSASAGLDFVSPGSSLSVAAFSDKTVDTLDDFDGEGVETIILTLTNPGLNYLFAPPGTQPATTPSVQLELNDNVSVKDIQIVAIPASQASQILGHNVSPTYNDHSGFLAYLLFVVKGERLENVRITQRIYAQTRVWDFNGNEFSPQQVLQLAQQVTANVDPNVVNSQLDNGGGWPVDTNADSKSLITAVTDPAGHVSTGLALDQHAYALPSSSQGNVKYTYLATIDRRMRIDAHLVNQPSKIKKSVTWGYTWSNQPCTWRATDNPAAPVVIASGSNKNNDRGQFSATELVLGLEQSN